MKVLSNLVTSIVYSNATEKPYNKAHIDKFAGNLSIKRGARNSWLPLLSGPNLQKSKMPVFQEAKERILQDDYAGAIPLLDQVIKENPTSADAYAWRGLARGRLHQNSIEDFNHALKLDGKNRIALIYRAVCFGEQFYSKDIDRVLENHPFDFLARLSKTYNGQGIHESVSDALQLVKQFPGNAAGWIRLCQLYSLAIDAHILDFEFKDMKRAIDGLELLLPSALPAKSLRRRILNAEAPDDDAEVTFEIGGTHRLPIRYMDPDLRS